jgi:hypothetical protein
MKICGIVTFLLGMIVVFSNKCGTPERIDGHFVIIGGILILIWSDVRKILYKEN